MKHGAGVLRKHVTERRREDAYLWHKQRLAAGMGDRRGIKTFSDIAGRRADGDGAVAARLVHAVGCDVFLVKSPKITLAAL